MSLHVVEDDVRNCNRAVRYCHHLYVTFGQYALSPWEGDTGDGVAVEGVGVVPGDERAVGCLSVSVVRLGVGLGVAWGCFVDGFAVENGRWETPYRDSSFIERTFRHTISTCKICKIPGVSHTILV